MTVSYAKDKINRLRNFREPLMQGDQVIVKVHEHALLWTSRKLREEVDYVAQRNWILQVNDIDCLEAYLHNNSLRFQGLREIFVDNLDIVPPRRVHDIHWDTLLKKCPDLKNMYLQFNIDCFHHGILSRSNISLIKWFQLFVRQVYYLERMPKMFFECCHRGKAKGAFWMPCDWLAKWFDLDLCQILIPTMDPFDETGIETAKIKIREDFRFDDGQLTFLKQHTRLEYTFAGQLDYIEEVVDEYAIDPVGLYHPGATFFWQSLRNYM